MNATIEKLLDQYEKYQLSEVIDYDKFNSYSIVHHSSTIEGATLSEIETRLLLDENLTPKGKPLDHSLMVKDHFAALQFVWEIAKEKRPISAGFIQQVNGLVMKHTGNVYNTIFGTIDASKGMFRKGNVSAGGSYFINYDKVEGLVKEFSDELNSRLAVATTKMGKLEASFVAHFHLVTIHPFYDGNGRTSRLLMNYVQQISNLPLAIVYKEDRAAYFQALQDTRKVNNIEIFKSFMYSQFEKHLKNEIGKFRDILPKKGTPENDSGYSMMF